MNKVINTFDIDGVIYMGKNFTGVFPGPDDIIITGRSFEESNITLEMLYSRNIHNQVYFNPAPFEKKTRKSSGQHKANIISMLLSYDYNIGIHFEDDPVQIKEIKKVLPKLNIVYLKHNLVNKENVWPEL